VNVFSDRLWVDVFIAPVLLKRGKAESGNHSRNIFIMNENKVEHMLKDVYILQKLVDAEFD
jgi:hypothetical protein